MLVRTISAIHFNDMLPYITACECYVLICGNIYLMLALNIFLHFNWLVIKIMQIEVNQKLLYQTIEGSLASFFKIRISTINLAKV